MSETRDQYQSWDRDRDRDQLLWDRDRDRDRKSGAPEVPRWSRDLNIPGHNAIEQNVQ